MVDFSAPIPYPKNMQIQLTKLQPKNEYPGFYENIGGSLPGLIVLAFNKGGAGVVVQPPECGMYEKGHFAYDWIYFSDSKHWRRCSCSVVFTDK